MSLDISLVVTDEDPGLLNRKVIPYRENGKVVLLSLSEWRERFPNKEPIALPVETHRYVYEANITHNLATMADKAGIYQAMWCPEDIGAKKAVDLIPVLFDGLEKLLSDPGYYKTFNPPNMWGDYGGLVDTVKEYLQACIQYPDATIEVSR